MGAAWDASRRVAEEARARRLLEAATRGETVPRDDELARAAYAERAEQWVKLALYALGRHDGRFASLAVPAVLVDYIAQTFARQGFSVRTAASYTGEFRQVTLWHGPETPETSAPPATPPATAAGD